MSFLIQLERKLARTYSMPTFLVQELVSTVKLPIDQVERICYAMNDHGPTFLRVNSLKTTRQDVLDRLEADGIDARAVNLSPMAILLVPPETPPHRFGEKPRASPLTGHGLWGLNVWREGLCEVQDLGSQMIVDVCEVREGITCLDYCAGNGGKSLALASKVGLDGKVFCYDIDTTRFEKK